MKTEPTDIMPDKVEILPYVKSDGIWTLKDSEVKALYERLASEGTASIAFPDDLVTSPDEFLNVMKYGANALYLVWGWTHGPREHPIYEQIAIVWLSNFINRTAFIHFCSFKGMAGKDSVIFGKEVNRRILFQHSEETGEHYLDMVYGVIPMSNRVARIYARKVGAISLGPVPYGTYNRETRKSEPAEVFYLTRDQLAEV